MVDLLDVDHDQRVRRTLGLGYRVMRWEKQVCYGIEIPSCISWLPTDMCREVF